MDADKSRKISPIKRRRDLVEYFIAHNLVGVDGFKQAMKACEYAPQYARENAERLLNDEGIQQLIRNEKERHEYTREKATLLLKKLKDDCETNSDRTNKLGCIKELNRIHGLYGDEDTGINITQVIVSPQERRAVLAKEMKLLDDIEEAPLAIAE